MRRDARLALGLLTLIAAGCQAGTPQPPGAAYEGDAFTFTEIRDGVYHARGTGSMVVGANAAVIVNEHDVLLVDSHMTPAAAWALLRELQAITDKPVRYVVNTHFHFDHVHGNQIFGDDVEVIGHEFTREMIAGGGSASGRAWDAFVGPLPEQVAELRARAEAAPDDQELQHQLAIQENYLAATNSVEAVAPTTTLAQRMTLFRGGREIRLIFFGRGHTGGDVVVHLPEEGVLITGDLLTEGLPYMGDGYPREWIETLEQLKPLAFDVVLPGHGQAFTDRAKIDYLQAYLMDLWRQVVALHAQGVSAEDAAAQIDMRAHGDHFTINSVGVNPHAVMRMYGLMEGTER